MFDCKKCNSKNNDKCGCVFKNLKEHMCAKKIIFGILLDVVVKMADI